jgi:hypothetical protein
MTNNDRGERFLDLTFSPSIRLVSILRRFAGAFYGEMLADPDLVSRLEVATHEILENAVKACTSGIARLRIELIDETQTIRLRTWNCAAPDDIEVLKARIVEMEAASDPFSYYVGLMGRTAKQTTGSGLGLGRVLAEAEMTVRFEIEDGQVCVVADAAFLGSPLLDPKVTSMTRILPSIELPLFKASSAERGRDLVLVLLGTADTLDVMEALSAFIGTVHVEALRVQAQTVIVDLKGVEFMASNNFKVFVNWLASLNELKEDERFRIRFILDPQRHWQRRSVHALAAFGGALVEVQS